ncbi:protein IMPACT-B-like isoform X2 [Antedon mediterranea]|uniref:protein IMPACT-B-like isoform X2 n=1 Tax=Antedon mediterranea TaxID=105859 RepID=UPI003AF90E9A
MMATEDNLTRQVEEIEALAAIYGDEWCVVDEVSRIFCIAVTEGSEKNTRKVCLQVMLPAEYPSSECPIYQINAPWLREKERMEFSERLLQVCQENTGECMVHLLIESIRESLIMTENVDSHIDLLPDQLTVITQNLPDTQIQDFETPEIHHGDAFTERRSTFQAHFAHVYTPSQVKEVIKKLYENRKIANASHNIVAYRIFCEDRGTFIQDCDDDGETAAGGRVLHLLQILDLKNVLMVVSRWYGGILLGPDRFKHINNSARNLIQQLGLINSKSDNAKVKKSKAKKTR